MSTLGRDVTSEPALNALPVALLYRLALASVDDDALAAAMVRLKAIARARDSVRRVIEAALAEDAQLVAEEREALQELHERAVVLGLDTEPIDAAIAALDAA